MEANGTKKVLGNDPRIESIQLWASKTDMSNRNYIKDTPFPPKGTVPERYRIWRHQRRDDTWMPRCRQWHWNQLRQRGAKRIRLDQTDEDNPTASMQAPTQFPPRLLENGSNSKNVTKFLKMLRERKKKLEKKQWLRGWNKRKERKVRKRKERKRKNKEKDFLPKCCTIRYMIESQI